MPEYAHKVTKPGALRVEGIYHALFNAILAQELLPGTKLSEEAIGSFFKASRTIVRAALNRLHTDSLVEFKQNRGAFVASPSLDEARQVFEARNCLERAIISLLAKTVTDQQIDALARHVEKEADARGDNPGSIILSGEFHLMTAKMAGNEVFAGFLKSLISRTSLILAQHGRHEESDCNVDEHRVVIEALRTRDPDVAINAMTAHLRHVLDRSNLVDPRRPTRPLQDVLSQYA
jgi:DNA-binding GntR family transcriptional regulator